MLNLKNYKSKPIFVEAVQIQENNMAEIATWVEGEVITLDAQEDKPAVSFVKTHVLRSKGYIRNKGYVGDWLVKSDLGVKIYTDSAFQRAFETDDSSQETLPLTD